MTKFLSFMCIILLMVTNFENSSGARILAINFISSKSHFIVFSPLLYGLAERGHEVTIFTPDPPGKPMENVRHIQIQDSKDGVKVKGILPNLFNVKQQMGGSEFWKYFNNCNFWRYRGYVEAACRRGYEHPFMQELLKTEFDLVILTPLYNECLYGFLHQLNVTTVLFSQVSILPWIAESFGAPTLPSFNPLLYYGFSDHMDFWERTINFLGVLYFEAVLKFYYNPAMERIYRKYINSNVPSVKEIERNFSLILANSHVSFVPPKPMLPDIIEVGGLHLRPPQPLPKELDDFCNGSGDDGFILFSMGTFLQGSSMPEKYRQMFIRTFSRLKQRILWKWESETMDDLPPNVKISKWLPQQDVLGHENIRLFITHGGHGSTTEALYAGVPLVGIPMFSDQFWNMEQAVRKGFAVSIAFNDLSEERLLESINQVLQNSMFQQKAKFLAKLYDDNLQKPLDRAIYWVEYVLRYDGAPHLRSAGRHLNIFQYFSLDVIAFLSILVGLSIALQILLVRAVWRLFWKLIAPNSVELQEKTRSKRD